MDQWLATFTEHPWEPQLVVLLSTAYAMVLGGIVGFERELKNRPAGFRTHMLVAGASALLVAAGLAPSNSEANRKLKERAVRIDGEVLEDAQRVFAPGFEGVLAIGKRNFARVRLLAG